MYLYDRTYVQPIKVIIQSWCVRKLAWQNAIRDMDYTLFRLPCAGRDAFLWIKPESKLWYQNFQKEKCFRTVNWTAHIGHDNWIRNVRLRFQVSRHLCWVEGLIIPDVSKERTAFIIKAWRILEEPKLLNPFQGSPTLEDEGGWLSYFETSVINNRSQLNAQENLKPQHQRCLNFKFPLFLFASCHSPPLEKKKRLCHSSLTHK